MDEPEPSQETRVERSAVFSDVLGSTIQDADALASLNQIFEFDVNSYLQPTTSQSSPKQSADNPPVESTEFNLFSTKTEPVQVSLTQPVYEVPLVNRKRPQEYYFTDPYRLTRALSYIRNDKERISKLVAVAMTASQIIESSSQPWAAKRNPRLLTTIPAHPEKVKKRRKPSKKERDYKKKIKLEEEEKARNERRYEKCLKYGQGQTGSRGHATHGRGRGGIHGS